MAKSELEQFLALFPLKATITQEIIDTAHIFRTHDCIGAKTLREVLPESLKHKTSWGANNSAIAFNGKTVFLITEENVNMMKVTEPMEVTFILDKRYN